MNPEKKLNLNNLHFLYNAAAHLEAQKRYPEGLVQEIVKEDADGLKALCYAISELSTRGELVRRMQGFEKAELWAEDEVAAVITPFQMMQAKGLVLQAIMHGMKPPEDEHAEVDEVLAEIEKKTAMA